MNALNMIEGVKQKLHEIAPSLPPGVQIEAGYDRSVLIQDSIERCCMDRVSAEFSMTQMDYAARLRRRTESGRPILYPKLHLWNVAPALVRQRTEELLNVFADTPRFVLNSGCALPADTPTENIRAMCACLRNHPPVFAG